jgi:hypothetical protein
MRLDGPIKEVSDRRDFCARGPLLRPKLPTPPNESLRMRVPPELLPAVLGMLALLSLPLPVPGQGITRPRVRDSNVGYIDSAIPGWNARFQFDSSDDNRSGTRSEFIWSGPPPLGRGLPLPERNIDYQDVTLQLEGLVAEQTSVFVAAPVRMLDPEINPNTAGLGDLQVGVKHAVIMHEDLTASLQLRVYVPTADVDRGLGTGHVSLEPAALLYMPLGCGWTAEAELRDWIPVGGTDFAGNVLRYGLGIHYDWLGCDCSWSLVPIAEFVGWTSLDGLVSALPPSGIPEIQDATGDTIVNVKLGTRLRFQDQFDIYTGFGRPLSGDTWYENTFRAELRLLY